MNKLLEMAVNTGSLLRESACLFWQRRLAFAVVVAAVFSYDLALWSFPDFFMGLQNNPYFVVDPLHIYLFFVSFAWLYFAATEKNERSVGSFFICEGKGLLRFVVVTLMILAPLVLVGAFFVLFASWAGKFPFVHAYLLPASTLMLVEETVFTIAAVWFLLLIKVFPVFPATMRNEELSLKQAWRMMRGHVISMAIVFAIVCVGLLYLAKAFGAVQIAMFVPDQAPTPVMLLGGALLAVLQQILWVAGLLMSVNAGVRVYLNERARAAK